VIDPYMHRIAETKIGKGKIAGRLSDNRTWLTPHAVVYPQAASKSEEKKKKVGTKSGQNPNEQTVRDKGRSYFKEEDRGKERKKKT